MMKWLKELFCKHEWNYYSDNSRGSCKVCTKCLKDEKVYMGWV